MFRADCSGFVLGFMSLCLESVTIIIVDEPNHFSNGILSKTPKF